MGDSSSGLILTDEFTAALSHLEAGGHLFLTGKAGTGKSTLVRTFMATTPDFAHSRFLVIVDRV